MSNTTIRTGLIDAINQLMRLSDVCSDPNQSFELGIKIRELFQKLDRVIVTTLTDTTPEFEQALVALDQLTIQATEALDDATKIAATINKAGEVVGKVEKLVVGVAGVLAIL